MSKTTKEPLKSVCVLIHKRDHTVLIATQRKGCPEKKWREYDMHLKDHDLLRTENRGQGGCGIYSMTHEALFLTIFYGLETGSDDELVVRQFSFPFVLNDQAPSIAKMNETVSAYLTTHKKGNK